MLFLMKAMGSGIDDPVITKLRWLNVHNHDPDMTICLRWENGYIDDFDMTTLRW